MWMNPGVLQTSLPTFACRERDPPFAFPADPRACKLREQMRRARLMFHPAALCSGWPPRLLFALSLSHPRTHTLRECHWQTPGEMDNFTRQARPGRAPEGDSQTPQASRKGPCRAQHVGPWRPASHRLRREDGKGHPPGRLPRSSRTGARTRPGDRHFLRRLVQGDSPQVTPSLMTPWISQAHPGRDHGVLALPLSASSSSSNCSLQSWPPASLNVPEIPAQMMQPKFPKTRPHLPPDNSWPGSSGRTPQSPCFHSARSPPLDPSGIYSLPSMHMTLGKVPEGGSLPQGASSPTFNKESLAEARQEWAARSIQ